MLKKTLPILFLFFVLLPQGYAQDTKTKVDSSKAIYQDIEKFSKKKKFTRFIHRLIFRPTRSVTTPRKEIKAAPPAKPMSYLPFEGKVIRKIRIETLDPFGYSVTNEDETPNKWIERFGNRIHIKTKNWTVRNLLLFKKYETVDSLKMRESERLVRRQRYVRSVTIKPVATNSPDSIDVVVRVLDSWSFIPTGAFTGSQSNLEITERNFLGLGHEFENNFKQRFSDNKSAYSAKYTIPNIRNTYINTVLRYEYGLEDDYIKGFAVERSFFSPLTRWAGGYSFEQNFHKEEFKDGTFDENGTANTIFQNFKTESQNFWGGHAFRIFKGRSEDNRITNLVTTARFYNSKFIEKPDVKYDSINYFANTKLYLTSIGITTRSFVQERYLFNYGIIEDVPVGRVYSITTGIHQKNGLKRLYLGSRVSFGDYHDFGFLGTTVEWGGYFNGSLTQQSVFRFEINYFTKLIEYGSWKFRQFIKPEFIIGSHRLQTDRDLLTLSGNNGIQGFDSVDFYGNRKIQMTFQTQSYMPGSWYGFRFSPFANFSFGMLGDQDHLFSNRLYSKFGLGVLISNDYLVFNSFQLSFAFYPSIPGAGDNIFKTNSFKNNDFGLQNFQIGNPSVIPYQ
ncbi:MULTISPECIES: BamA/TamA family outer membrane protein [Flavobacterium]|uniref:hypothetical protein n=1 Tax=Flavobacterium TaxID=237 RepID=UPI0015ACC1F3|nr:MULTISPECIES: hypothetical protein [Flavobacterium]